MTSTTGTGGESCEPGLSSVTSGVVGADEVERGASAALISNETNSQFGNGGKEQNAPLARRITLMPAVPLTFGTLEYPPHCVGPFTC